MTRFSRWFFVMLAAGLALLAAACGGAGIPAPTLEAAATPTAMQPPTWTPLPTSTPLPTPTPTPPPSWQMAQSWRPPTGWQFTAGFLAPDGQTVIAFAMEDVAEIDLDTLDMTMYVYRLGSRQPLWEGSLLQHFGLRQVDNAFWLPDGLLVLDGINTDLDPGLRVVNLDTMEVVWRREMVILDYGLNRVAYDAARQYLILNLYGVRGLQVYTWPGREKVDEKYTASDMSNGCCIPELLYTSQHGIATMGVQIFNPQRYYLMIWDGSGPQARQFPTDYTQKNWFNQRVVWGPKQQVGWIFMPATLDSPELAVLDIFDLTTGQVAWSVTEQDFPGLSSLAWLPQRGWLVGSQSGEVRLYTDAQTYETVRSRSSALLFYELQTTEAHNDRWLGVSDSRIELWVWK